MNNVLVDICRVRSLARRFKTPRRYVAEVRHIGRAQVLTTTRSTLTVLPPSIAKTLDLIGVSVIVVWPTS